MNYKRLIISLFLPQFVGFIGSLFTVRVVRTWYAVLEKPNFSPPNWIFGPVWIVLYILMGISVYLLWQRSDKKKKAKSLVTLFWIHLIFNGIWSIIFFGFQAVVLAFLDIIIIWILILVMIIKFWKYSKWSTYLLIPYFLWVSFAAVLNFFIWRMN